MRETTSTYLEVGLQPGKVQTDGAFIEISVSANFEARVLEEGYVVAPGGDGKVNGLGVGVVTRKEGASNTEGSSTRDGLGNGDL